MSRADKRHHRDHVVGTAKDAAVRLYAFANTRPGYHVVFSPEAPIVLLKTKRGAEDQHPCAQWAPFASLVFSQRPNTTHAVYVVDTTALPESMGAEEGLTPAVGPVVKRVSNVLARLNPHNATMVAAGVSAFLAFKYVIIGEKRLGHADRLVRRLILVCPVSIRPFQQLLQATGKRALAGEYPKSHLVVLLSDASQAREWREWLQGSANAADGALLSSFLDSWSVSTNLKPSLFAAVAREAGSDEDGTTVNLETHFDTPNVFRIDFFLSNKNKKTEQRVTLSPLTTTGCDDDDTEDFSEAHEENDEDEEEEEEEKGLTTKSEGSCSQECSRSRAASSVFGLLDLQHCRRPTRVIVEGRIMDSTTGVVGTTQGRVEIQDLRDSAESSDIAAGHLKLKKGLAVRVEAILKRDECGMTKLRALKAIPLTRMQEKRSMTVCPMMEVPTHNVSATAYAYGALLVRGRKCVLVRSLEGEFDGMRLPFLLHCDAGQSAMECAVQALCEQCDISPDNFYIPSYIPPVCYYDKSGTDGTTVCVFIYIALAVSPPSGGARDTVEEDEMPEEPYDWFGYAKAARLLQTEAEREVLQSLRCCLRRAYDAGLYVPLKGFGLFGDDVMDMTCSSEVQSSPSLQGLELMVVCAPGDVEGRSLKFLRENVAERVLSVTGSTLREEVERAALTAVMEGAHVLILCLSSDVDVNAFSEEELTYWWERDARPRCVTLLLPGVSEMIVEQRDEFAAATFISSVMLSDALVTVECDAGRFTPPTWGLLHLANRLNNDLMLYSGLATRQPINLFSSAAMTASIDASESTLHEITISRKGRPIIGSSLAPLLESGALAECCRHSVILWAQGDVWLASRPQARGVLTLDICSRCFALEKGDLWERHEDETTRESVISLYIWATPAERAKLESLVEDMLDGMLCTSTSSTRESFADDGLPPWD